MDFGNVPASDWYYAALGPGLLIGAVVLLRRARTAPAAVGLGLVMLGNGVQYPVDVMVWASTSAAQATWMSWLSSIFGMAVLFTGYVWLIGYVPAGWNAWMRRPWFKIGMSALIFATVIWWTATSVSRATFVVGEYPTAYDDGTTRLLDLPPGVALWWLIAAIIAASLAVAVSAAIRSTPGVNRRSAFAYLAGIGTIDVFILWSLLAEFWPGLIADALSSAWQWMGFTLYGVWFPAWVAYAILSTRLFDIDLRIKWAINQGSLVAIFVAVFFAVGLFMQEWLTQSLGLLGGAVAAGALFLVLTPLRRFTAGIASRVMPNTVATPAYEAHRKVEIYREALRDTLETGGSITASERRLLDRLRDQLGLDAPSVAVLESEARAA